MTDRDADLRSILGMLEEACDMFRALLDPQGGEQEFFDFTERDDRDHAITAHAFAESARQQLAFVVTKREREREAIERQRRVAATELPF